MIPELRRLRQEGQALKTSLDYLEKLSHEMRVTGLNWVHSSRQRGQGQRAAGTAFQIRKLRLFLLHNSCPSLPQPS